MLKTILFIKNKHRTIDYVFNWRNNAHSVMNVDEIKFFKSFTIIFAYSFINILTVRKVCNKSGYTKH